MRPVEPRPEEPRAGVEFLGSGQGSKPPSHQLEDLGSAVKFGFWSILEPQKSRQNGQIMFFFHTAAVCSINRRLQRYTRSSEIKARNLETLGQTQRVNNTSNH